MTISAHCLVKNEERFIWYAIMSVAGYMDKLFIWDTGSTDLTREIVKYISRDSAIGRKVDYRDIGEVDKKTYSGIRQLMLNETKTDWVFILDGDEIWWEDSIKGVIKAINSDKSIESVINPTINLVGDMFHYQEEAAGQYNFGERKGHLNLRALNRKIPGLHVHQEYGKEGFADVTNKPIQERDKNKSVFINAPYLHATHLKRSSGDNTVMQRKRKLKYEIGIEFPDDFYYPEVFFRPKPEIVRDVWETMELSFIVPALIQTPLKKLKRRLV